MQCPMCGLKEKFQKPSKKEGKTKCKGCLTVFFDKDRR